MADTCIPILAEEHDMHDLYPHLEDILEHIFTFTLESEDIFMQMKHVTSKLTQIQHP